MQNLLKLFSLFTALILLTACREASPPAHVDLARRPSNAATTIGIIGGIVKNVGGERGNVIGLMGPSVDPHLSTASEGEVVRLAKRTSCSTTACIWKRL